MEDVCVMENKGRGRKGMFGERRHDVRRVLKQGEGEDGDDS